MFKKFPWKTVLVTLLAWALFWEVKETITGERWFFLYRWTYSGMFFEKNIEILTYILNDEQVSYMLTHPDEEVHQPGQKDLYLKNANVVLRIRNLKGGSAYGRLSWFLRGYGWNVVDIDDIPVRNNPKKYGDFIISMGILVGREDTLPEPVKVKWDELYVYR